MDFFVILEFLFRLSLLNRTSVPCQIYSPQNVVQTLEKNVAYYLDKNNTYDSQTNTIVLPLLFNRLSFSFFKNNVEELLSFFLEK